MMNLVLLLWVCVLSPLYAAVFTCQGGNDVAALAACPDTGVQDLTLGGNVTILVKYATNLPNRDASGPAAGVSDPYVKFKVGGVVKTTRNIRNNLNPVWNQEVNLGVLQSATLVQVEIWDKDGGLEFGDDILTRGNFRVPFCSSFAAKYAHTDEELCGQPFGCSADDSMWAMPVRKRCNETGEIRFNPVQACTQSGAVCLFIQVFITPFLVNVEQYRPNALTAQPQISAATAPVTTTTSATWVTANAFGRPFLAGTESLVFSGNAATRQLNGAIMVRTTDNPDRYRGRANEIKYYVSTNFPAKQYVCRYVDDNDFGVPTWIQDEFSASRVVLDRLRLASNGQLLECFNRDVSGTTKNKYGGVEKGAIAMRTNTIPGFDNYVAAPTPYQVNYIPLFVPNVIVQRKDQVTISYDYGAFVGMAASYGLIFFWFVYLIARFLDKIDYRVDRVSSYLSSRVLTGSEKNLLAGLFVTYGASPQNIDFRAHMFHVRNIIYFLFLMPFLLLISWGFSCLAAIEPKALGLAIAFLGIAALLFWFGVSLWRRSMWRISPIALCSLGLSVLFFLFFLFGSIFLDAGVLQYGYDLNFTALALIFGTLNCLPLMMLAFKQDRSQTKNLHMVVQRMAEAVFYVKNPDSKVGVYKDLKINRILHALLGENYTINPKVPAFKFSAALFELADDKDADGNLDEAEVEEGKKMLARQLYGVSLVILLVYFIIAAVRTSFPSLAFLNCLALVLLDIIHLDMSHGDAKWNPGFMIALLIAGRVLIMGSPPSLWLLNYGACYALYACLLCNEMIRVYLPVLSKREAGEIAFSGLHDDVLPSPDVAGTAYFNLVLLTVTYSGVLMVAAFGVTNGALPVPDLKVLGYANWSITVFGLLALLMTLIVMLLFATSRAYYLDSHGLLRGWQKEVFFLRPSITLPRILAIASEIAILVTGFIVYASTGSPAMLIGCIYLPLIVMCFGLCWRTWLKNDYELIVWPRRKVAEGHGGLGPNGENPSDLEVAFNLIEDLFGQPSPQKQHKPGATMGSTIEADGVVVNIEDGNPESGSNSRAGSPTNSNRPKTLKNFQLPELKATGNKVDEIKMPPLPLKSVLRKKRQNLGIKAKMPLVKDLRTRDDAVDNDKFGNSDDVIDVTDPWAQFERNEEEEAEQKRQEIRNKKKAVTTTVAKKESIWKNPTVVATMKCFKSCGNYISATYDKVVGSCNNGSKVAPADKYLVEEDADGEASPATAMTIKSGMSGKLNARTSNNQDLESGEGEDEALMEVDVDALPFEKAMWGGYLNSNEYSLLGAWYGGLFLVMMFGVTLTLALDPPYIGQVIWVAIITFICTMVPIIKYFNTYTFDRTSLNLLKFVALMHFVFCLTFFIAYLKGDVGLVGSLWIFDYFLYYPLFLYIAFEIYRWYDAEFKFAELDGNHDGKVSFREALNYLRATPVLICAVILFNWQLYVWVGIVVGEVTTLLLIVCIIAYIYLRDWATNDFYLSPELLILGGYGIKLALFITFCVAIFSATNPIFAISVFCFILMFERLLIIGQRIAVSGTDTIYFYSPFVLPVYSYDMRRQDVVNESELALHIFYTLFIGVVWGCFMAIFFYPVNIGVALACCFLLAIAALTALAVSYVPSQLAKASIMLTPDGIVECANAAKEKFTERRQPINLEMREWDTGHEAPKSNGEDNSAEESGSSSTKTPLDRLKERTALTNAVDMTNDVRALKYVRDEKSITAADELEDVDEFEPKWYEKLWGDFKDGFKAMIEMLPIPRHTGWKKHSQGTFGFKDASMECFIRGKGPLGFMGMEGMFYRFACGCKDSPNWARFYPTILDSYDDLGNNVDLVQLTEAMDIRGVLARLRDLDEAIEFSFAEETRCAVHFLLMLLVGADVKLQREQVLFQKFLRENRFRLASNGITPPPDIFSSASFSSINIRLVAAWLNTLSPDEKERFHMLKATFSAEQKERDELIDSSDYEIAFEAINLQKERAARDKFWLDKMSINIAKRKEQRLQEFIDSLQGFERQRFGQRRDLWMNDPECFVDMKEIDLYERFRTAYLVEHNDAVEYMQQAFVDIETAQKDARLGEYGRAYQFVDSEFMPGDGNIGDGQAASSVLGWRCAPGICEEVMLFDGGTHPDEVCEGVFRDTWLLSAINMLVAAQDFGNGIINQQIKGLFVGHAGPDGETTLLTDVGAYCVQLFRNGEWTPIVVDDLFPMRKKDRWTNENRGMACAHNRECKGLWLPLIEKAFAKYYGNYSMLEKGYVHHALQDLTGCEAECIPLSGPSRGIGKRALWDSLVRYRKNGYILGAGTGDSNLVDKEIQDMGIVFDSAYTIYDVRTVNGHRLVKLRNPPGDHDEWKGDWSDKSPLWSRKLKKKLGHSDADDNTFFMAFDDFCNVFRNLYVCKYYNPLRWYEIAHPGVWKKSDEAHVEKMDVLSQLMREESEKTEDIHSVKNDRKRARAKIDSAGGLPTKHNPGCVLENNPYYSFRINRPTDFRISVTQYSFRGRQSLEIHPISILLVKNRDNNHAMRLETLVKEDVVYSTGEPRAERTLNLYGSSLEPGLYVVLVGAYMSGMEGQFKINVLTNHRTDFTPIWPPTWLLKGERENVDVVGTEGLVKETAREKAILKISKSGKANQSGKDDMFGFRAGIKSLFGNQGPNDGESDEDSKDEDDEET